MGDLAWERRNCCKCTVKTQVSPTHNGFSPKMCSLTQSPAPHHARLVGVATWRAEFVSVLPDLVISRHAQKLSVCWVLHANQRRRNMPSFKVTAKLLPRSPRMLVKVTAKLLPRSPRMLAVQVCYLESHGCLQLACLELD